MGLLAELEQHGIGVAELISIGSAFIALVSAVVAVVQGHRAHRLALSQESRKAPRLECVFHQFARDQADEQDVLKFNVTISNRSELPNSVRAAKLQAPYEIGNLPVVMQLPAEEYVEGGSGNEVTRNLPLPLRLGPYESYRWIVFIVNQEAAKRLRAVRKMRVTLDDEFEQGISFETNLVRT